MLKSNVLAFLFTVTCGIIIAVTPFVLVATACWTPVFKAVINLAWSIVIPVFLVLAAIAEY